MAKKKPRRATRKVVRPNRGYEVVGPGGKLRWNADLVGGFGSKEHYVILRLHPRPQRSRCATSVPDSAGRRRILVVDDIGYSRELYAFYLNLVGYHVKVALPVEPDIR